MIHVSYILPFYKRAAWLEVVAAHNDVFRAPHSEVVLVLDEPTQEQEVLRIVRELDSIRWRVIVNDQDHEWRPPSRAINVGVRHSLGDFLAIMSPETYIFTPGYDYIEHIAESSRGERKFYGGWLWLMENCANVPEESPLAAIAEHQEHPPTNRDGCGFLGVHKIWFMRMGGFSESRNAWGGDDVQVHQRLSHINAHLIDKDIHLVSPLHSGPQRSSRKPTDGAVVPWELQGWSYHRKAFDWLLNSTTA